jgi:hypothetical protein
LAECTVLQPPIATSAHKPSHLSFDITTISRNYHAAVINP